MPPFQRGRLRQIEALLATARRTLFPDLPEADAESTVKLLEAEVANLRATRDRHRAIQDAVDAVLRRLSLDHASIASLVGCPPGKEVDLVEAVRSKMDELRVTYDRLAAMQPDEYNVIIPLGSPASERDHTHQMQPEPGVQKVRKALGAISERLGYPWDWTCDFAAQLAIALSYVDELLEARRQLGNEYRASIGEVWHWQGDGFDFPESLTCPVLIEPDALRALLAHRFRADQLTREVVSLWHRVNVLTGNFDGFPVPLVLDRLADAADHLLRDHDCDQHGHEEIAVYRDAARRHAATLRSEPKPEKPNRVFACIWCGAHIDVDSVLKEMEPDVSEDTVAQVALEELRRHHLECPHGPIKDLQHSLDLQEKASQRAIQRWQARTGRTMEWPDQTNLVEWLLDQLAAREQALADAACEINCAGPVDHRIRVFKTEAQEQIDRARAEALEEAAAVAEREKVDSPVGPNQRQHNRIIEAIAAGIRSLNHTSPGVPDAGDPHSD